MSSPQQRLSAKDRKALRLAERQRRLEEEAREQAALEAEYAHVFGALPRVQSQTYRTCRPTPLSALSTIALGSIVTVRCRAMRIRKHAKVAFIVLRDGLTTIQAVVSPSEIVPKAMLGFIGRLAPESVVDVEARIRELTGKETQTSLSAIELDVQKLHIVSESAKVLPFQFDDASKPAMEGEDASSNDRAAVNLDTRLACRWMDMRTTASHAIFQLQSRMCQYFREEMIDRGFTEIHTPKLLGAASESGSSVFDLPYFNRKAFLAQSPQLYKQMAIQGDLEGVFEIGPVFRAENANTYRHLTEFVGLDFEMRITEHYYEVLDVAEAVFVSIFEKLKQHHGRELAAVRLQYPAPPFVHHLTAETLDSFDIGILDESKESTDTYGAVVRSRDAPVLRIHFHQGVSLLKTVVTEDPEEGWDDIGTEHEKLLGKLVKERYGVDFYIMDKYPTAARPFYTMLDATDPSLTNSFDMFVRGQEIVSGAQRIHDPGMLEDRLTSLNISVNSVKDYVDAFRLGAWPHGGLGIGCERLLCLFLGLPNVRYCSMFPRDPTRLTP